MQNPHVVTRHLPMGRGRILAPGAVIDASEVTHLRLLLDQRYLAPATPEQVRRHEEDEARRAAMADIASASVPAEQGLAALTDAFDEAAQAETATDPDPDPEPSAKPVSAAPPALPSPKPPRKRGGKRA